MTSLFTSKRGKMEHTSSTDENASLTRNTSRSSSSSSSSYKKCKSALCSIRIDGSDVKEHKCSAECLDKYPIHHAARRGNFKLLRQLLDDPLCSNCPLEPDECLGKLMKFVVGLY